MRSTRVDWRLTLGVYLLEGDEIMLIAWSNQNVLAVTKFYF